MKSVKSHRYRSRERWAPDFSANRTPAMCRALNGEVWDQEAVEPDGSVLCGQLTSDDSGNLLLVAPDKKTIPVANVVSLKVVQECL